jgi:phosphomannomutase
MSQWHTVPWKELEDAHKWVGEIRLDHEKIDGKVVITASHHTFDWNSLDFSAERNAGVANHHTHDISHIRLLPVSRPQGVSVHAIWHDRDGNVVRQDAHFDAR